MLKSLDIDNYAIISELHIDWADGLNIVTGQTGAGKSVILGALSLLSGQKADASLLLDKEKSLVIEALFDIEGYGLENFLTENDIDPCNQITVRRQISPVGKSRCFIEDIPVAQNVLKDLTDRLVDVHSQHKSLLLSRQQFQMDILDAIAGCRELRRQVQEQYEKYDSSRKKRDQLRVQVENSERDRDYINYRIEQLESLKITPGETASLEQRLSVIEHSEDIARSLSSLYQSLEDGDNAICHSLQQLSRNISSASKYMENLAELSERLQSSAIELKDIADEAGEKLSSLSFDENEKQLLEHRLDEINDALSRYGANDEEHLLSMLLEMKHQMDSIEENRQLLANLDKETSLLFDKLQQLCADLSSKRKKSVNEVEKHVQSTLISLGIREAKFKVEITAKDPSADGIDLIEFLFSANELSPIQPIGKTASGGEISRLMLALKSMAASKMKLPTIVFDEIDTGVSGAVADSMGNMIVSMASSMQVINITHLPQVAAKGQNHYEVYKQDSKTYIVKLDPARRLEKIAEMLSGADITDAARQQARQLLNLV